MRFRLLTICCCMFLPFINVKGADIVVEKFGFSVHKQVAADSIIQHVLDSVSVFGKKVDEYDANLYVKGKVDVLRRNRLLRYLPTVYSFDRKVRGYMTESMSELHYTAPDIYDMKVKSVTSTFRRNSGKVGDAMQFFKMNVYSSTFLTDKILSPLSKGGLKRYIYALDSVWTDSKSTFYKVAIHPKYKSNKLVEGYVVVNGGDWSLREVNFKGKLEFLKFSVNVMMGDNGNAVYLPHQVHVQMIYGLLGNRLKGDYRAFYKYNLIRTSNTPRISTWKKHSHDLSDSYQLTCDSTHFVSNDLYMNFHRPIPLTDDENIIYTTSMVRKNSRKQEKTVVKETKSRAFWGEVGDVLLSNYNIDLSSLGSVKMSPLINPVMFSYSHSSGISYKQVFKYTRLMQGDRMLRIWPRFSYSFSRKELYWRVNSEWIYAPSINAGLRVDVGGGDRVSSSKIVDEIKQIPDSVFNIDKLDFDYYRDNYVNAAHEIEPVNGLKITAGISLHHRVPKHVNIEDGMGAGVPGSMPGILENLRKSYDSFAPHVRIDWTPGQYYYMRGKRKINLHSPFPTFSFDWERGLKGVLGSDSEYERFEIDMQHKIIYPSMKSLYYRIGGGLFTNQRSVYFADFSNFYRHDLPNDWDDDNAGTFQLLDRRWFNASDKYFRGHLTYQMPFLLFAHLGKFTRIVQHENLYFSLLCIPKLMPYTEIGYGFETHLFDLGIFASFNKASFNRVGFSFSFQLFR